MVLFQNIKDQYNTLLPPRCVECRRLLVKGEEVLCLECIAGLPLTYDMQPPVTSLMHYNNPGVVQRLLIKAKFSRKPWINGYLMQLMLPELERQGWPFDIDAIIPVPQHWLRMLTRGYNQVTPIADVLSKAWCLPVLADCLYRRRYVSSQIGLSHEDRIKHLEGVFAVRNIHHITELPSRRLPGYSTTEPPHILLVDDVLTTGTTVYSARDALEAAIPGIRVTILTIARVV